MADKPKPHKPTETRTSNRQGADPARKNQSPPSDAAEKESTHERAKACNALGDERFPEQCDEPLAENSPPHVMPDQKKAQSKGAKRGGA